MEGKADRSNTRAAAPVEDAEGFVIDAARAANQARELSREEFAARYRDRYLAVFADGNPMPVAFHTVVVASGGGAASSRAALPEIVPVRKTGRNPYATLILIGRARNCDIALRHASISKLHAHLEPQANGDFDLVDLDSQNGTSINDRPIGAHRPERICLGDIIALGTVKTTFVDSERLFELLQRCGG